MKRILFIIDSLNSGGAEKSLISLLSVFDHDNYKIDLMPLSPSGLFFPLIPDYVRILNSSEILKEQTENLFSLLKKGEIKSFVSRINTSVSLRNPLKKRFLHSAQIIWSCKRSTINNLEDKYDYAIAYSQGVPTYVVAEKVKADKKICWINTDYKAALYNKKFDEKYYSQFNKVIAVSDYCKKVFIEEMQLAKNKTDVLYDIISPRTIKRMALYSGGFEDNFKGVRLLTIGRLVDVKGYDMAIEAGFQLKQSGINFKWYILGEGNLKPKLEKMIMDFNLSEEFVFLGTHHNPYTYLKQCDIYVQPSRYEGYGLAIKEARILCKPIVATNFSVVHNQLLDKKNGLIVNMDSHSIYQGIKMIVEKPDLRRKFCKTLSEEQAGTEYEVDKLYEILESI